MRKRLWLEVVVAGTCLATGGAAFAQEAEGEPSSAPVPAAPGAMTGRPGDDLVRVDGGIGFLWGPSSKSYGLGAAAEVRWSPHDRVALGARLDGGIRGGGRVGTEGSSFTLGSGVAALGKVEGYLLPQSWWRPYVGLGAGVHSITGQGFQSPGAGGQGATADRGSFFGLNPQVGVDFETFRVGAGYHVLFGADFEVPDGAGMRRVSRNYFGLDLLYVLWRTPRAK